MKALLTINLLLIAAFCMRAQQNEVTVATFKETRIVNSQSSEVERKGFLKFIISHRFGAVNNEFFHNFLGLDNASARLGLDYGITDQITVGMGRSTFQKEFDGFVKWKILEKGTKAPFTLTALQSMVYRSEENRRLAKPSDDSPLNKIAYSTELYLSKLFTERIVIQLTPTFTYRNLVEKNNQPNAIYSQGLILGYKLSHKVALNLEYFYTPPSMVGDNITNPLSLGVDIGTNGHVFQFFMSNAKGMNAPNYINQTTGTWENGDLFFGFNVTRVFRIKAFQ